MAFLNINRLHILCFLLWQCALFYSAQQIFPIFYNYNPVRTCADSSFNFSKPQCELSRDEQCKELKNCSNIIFKDKPPFRSMIQDFDMYCDKKEYDATLVATIQFLGVLLGTVIYGHLGDHFGRRIVSIVGISIGIVFGIASGFAPSWPIFAAFRFVCGSSIACVLIVFYTYILEIILPEQRVFLRSFFNWGYARLVFTFVCFICGYWRLAAIATACLCFPIVPCMIFLLPESPKWYRIKGRKEDVVKSEQRLAWIAGIKYDPTEEEEHRPVDNKIYTMGHLFATRQLGFRTIIMGSLWFSTSLSAFGSDLNSGNLEGHFYLNQFVSAAVTALAKIFVFLLDEYYPKFDRRRLHQLPQALMIICYAVIMVLLMLPERNCDDQGGRNLAVIIINIIGVSFIEVTWDACYLVAVEIFPTHIRSIGIGTCSLLARVGALLAPQMAYLSNVYKWLPYSVVCGIGLLSLIVSFFFLPNTKGVDLDAVHKAQFSRKVRTLGDVKRKESSQKDIKSYRI